MATFPRSAVCFLLGLLLAPLFVSCELVGTILLSRHGTRAPNAVTVQLCPANSANLHRYSELDISLEGVTGRGMLQLYQLGQYTKERYVDSGFLLPYYSNEQMYIRAVGEDRTLQSAVAWGQALYPAGHAPFGYKADVPSPLPVYTLPDELDTLLENRKAGCHGRLKQDVEEWDNTEGEVMRQQYSALLQQLEQLCGVNLTAAIRDSGDNYGDAIKDITDNWTFDFIEHFPPLSGLTIEQLLQFRTYAVAQLVGRILGTAEQVTYMNGDLPISMLRSFQALIDQHDGSSGSSRTHSADVDREVKPLRFIAYHGHREMMYALAAFFDIRFNISYPALPLGAIPPATSIFFELHSGGKSGKEDGEYVVKAVLWTPCDDEAHTQALAPLMTIQRNNDTRASKIGNYSASYHHHSANHPHSTPKADASDWASEPQCGARSIAIGGCHHGVCSFDEFRALIHRQINDTGSWHTLCHPRQHSERYNHSQHSDHTDDDNKVGGAGRTADHSPGYGATEGSREEEKGKGRAAGTAHAHGGKQHGHNSTHYAHNSTRNGTASSDEDDSSSSGRSGWTVLFWVMLISAIIGCAGYYYFVIRPQRDRGEYLQVPSRP